MTQSLPKDATPTITNNGDFEWNAPSKLREERKQFVGLYKNNKEPTDNRLDAEKSVGLSILLSIHKKNELTYLRCLRNR